MEQKDRTHIWLLKIAMIATSALIALPGCAVGPDYRRPDAPETGSFTAGALPEKTVASPVAGGEEQRFVSKQDIPDQWWTLFQCPDLDELIRLALKDNPSLAAARATLRQAQENLNAGYGALFPSLDAQASVSRQKVSGISSGEPNIIISPYTVYNASVNVSYMVDLFGGTRRELETLQSQVDYQQFQIEAAYLTLTSNVVTTAVKEASLRAQIRSYTDIIGDQEKQLKVVEQQFRLGGVSLPDLLAQKAQLAQTRAVLPPLEKELSQTGHQLAVLTGRLPSEAKLPDFDLDGLKLPRELPVSLPSELVRQRPDIRAAEALLHAASAQVGVATANLYPQVTLSGSFGSVATKAGDLFASGMDVWSLGAGVLQPVFHGGELTARRRAAVAAYDAASAQYRETVLQAFQNVADVLRALDADALALKAQAEAEAAARDSRDITGKQFSLGAVSYLTLLDSERQYQQARIALVQVQAVRYADTAALFQALGGGWWNRQTQGDAKMKVRRESGD